jgi:hypothetical protein
MRDHQNLDPSNATPASAIAPPHRDQYDQEAVQEILQLAIARRSHSDDFSRSQLLDMAAELGIGEADLVAAEQQWLTQRGDRPERDRYRADQQARLKRQLTRYGISNGFLLLMNLVTSHQLDWSLLILLGWGLVLSLDAWKSLQMEGEDFEKRYYEWQLARKTIDDWQ